MKKRIVPMLMAVLLAVSVMAPAASAVSARAISGRPTLKISGTTAYCFGKYSSGNQEDEISITVTLKQGAQTITSWSASGKGSVTISETYTVAKRQTYKLVLSATVNGRVKPDITVTATGR